MRPLELGDIVDLRAYERVREEYRRRIIELKRRRRVALGDIMSVVFENAETVRFQVQEMARVERIISDEGIQEELDVYNRLLPGDGELSATLFIELTTDEQLRRWLPALVGIESALGIELASGAVVPSRPEASHAGALVREDVTPAVHYLRFSFSPEATDEFAGAPAALVSRHPAYPARAELSEEVRGELLGDLRGTAALGPLA